eukprot:scaffold249_cov342-Pavlova_lutheri.AAC.4
MPSPTLLEASNAAHPAVRCHHLLSSKPQMQPTWLSDAVTCCPGCLKCNPPGCGMPSPVVLEASNAARNNTHGRRLLSFRFLLVGLDRLPRRVDRRASSFFRLCS